MYYYLLCVLVSDQTLDKTIKRQMGLALRVPVEHMVKQLCRLFSVGQYIVHVSKGKKRTDDEIKANLAWQARDVVMVCTCVSIQHFCV
jgi:hypothetical protein